MTLSPERYFSTGKTKNQKTGSDERATHKNLYSAEQLHPGCFPVYNLTMSDAAPPLSTSEAKPNQFAAPKRLNHSYSIVFRSIELKGLQKWQQPVLQFSLSNSSGNDEGEPPMQGVFASTTSDSPTESNEEFHKWCLVSESGIEHRVMRASSYDDPSDSLPALEFKEFSQISKSTVLNVCVLDASHSAPSSPGTTVLSPQRHIFTELLPISSSQYLSQQKRGSPSKLDGGETSSIPFRSPTRKIALGNAKLEALLEKSPNSLISMSLVLRVPERTKGGGTTRLRRATYEMRIDLTMHVPLAHLRDMNIERREKERAIAYGKAMREKKGAKEVLEYQNKLIENQGPTLNSLRSPSQMSPEVSKHPSPKPPRVDDAPFSSASSLQPPIPKAKITPKREEEDAQHQDITYIDTEANLKHRRQLNIRRFEKIKIRNARIRKMEKAWLQGVRFQQTPAEWRKGESLACEKLVLAMRELTLRIRMQAQLKPESMKDNDTFKSVQALTSDGICSSELHYGKENSDALHEAEQLNVLHRESEVLAKEVTDLEFEAAERESEHLAMEVRELMLQVDGTYHNDRITSIDADSGLLDTNETDFSMPDLEVYISHGKEYIVDKKTWAIIDEQTAETIGVWDVAQGAPIKDGEMVASDMEE